MDKNRHKGAITIYLSIILSAVIMLCGVLMDVVRIKVAEVQVRRAANTAAFSVLAGFETKLKQEYGLFALHNNDKNYLKAELEYYMGNQLNNDSLSLNRNQSIVAYPTTMYIDGSFKQVKFIDLFDYKIESLAITPIYNLTENEISKHQIIEYMKYRAPIQFAEDFFNKVQYAASTESLASGYKQKTIIERRLGGIEKGLNRLQGYINFANKFQVEDFNNISGDDNSLMQLCRNIAIREIYRACKEVDLEKNATNEEKSKQIKDSIEEAYEAAARRVSDITKVLEDRLSECQAAVDGAIEEIENIQSITAQVNQDIEVLKAYIENSNADVSKVEVEVKSIDAMKKDLEGYESLLQSSNTQGILKDLTGNRETLNLLRVSLASIDNDISLEAGDICNSAIQRLRSLDGTDDSMEILEESELSLLMHELKFNSKLINMKQAADNYQRVRDVLRKAEGSKGADPRKKAAESLNKARNEMDGDGGKSKKITHPELLPSYFANGVYPNKVFSEGITDNKSPDYNLPKVVEAFDADFDEESGFAEEGFSYLARIADRLKNKALDLRDEIYVNEYILKTFKDTVEIKQSNTDGKSSPTFFDKGEVEYILGGKASEQINKLLVKGQILLIRLGMNTLHVYSDSQKRLQALEAATAVAGFTGFGIPIAHNLIMCAWGAAEAYYDIEDLYNGKKVPFIKTKEVWRTDLLPTGFSTDNTAAEANGIMDFDYHDYLRLLLLVEDNQAKLNRVQDLIQLNVQQSTPGFYLSSYNTYVKVEAQVSIKYWFITKLFVPAKSKSEDGSRHVIKVEAWRGY